LQPREEWRGGGGSAVLTSLSGHAESLSTSFRLAAVLLPALLLLVTGHFQ